MYSLYSLSTSGWLLKSMQNQISCSKSKLWWPTICWCCLEFFGFGHATWRFYRCRKGCRRFGGKGAHLSGAVAARSSRPTRIGQSQKSYQLMNEWMSVWSGLREYMSVPVANGLLRFWRQIERVMINNSSGSQSHLNTLRMRNALHASRPRKRTEGVDSWVGCRELTCPPKDCVSFVYKHITKARGSGTLEAGVPAELFRMQIQARGRGSSCGLSNNRHMQMGTYSKGKFLFTCRILQIKTACGHTKLTLYYL